MTCQDPASLPEALLLRQVASRKQEDDPHQHGQTCCRRGGRQSFDLLFRAGSAHVASERTQGFDVLKIGEVSVGSGPNFGVGQEAPRMPHISDARAAAASQELSIKDPSERVLRMMVCRFPRRIVVSCRVRSSACDIMLSGWFT